MPKYIEIDDVQYVKSNFARLASKRGDEFNHVLNMEIRVEDKDVKVCKEILRQRLPHLFTPSGLLKQNVFQGMSMRSFEQVLQYAYCDEIEGRKLNSRELLFLINWCMKWNMPDRLKALLWNQLSSCTDATNCVDVYFQMESMNGKLDEVKRFREYCLHVMKSYVCNNSASQVVDLSDHPELLETIIYKPHENFTDIKLPVSSYTSDMTKIIGCKGVVSMKIMLDPSTSMRVSPTVMAVQSPAINAFLLQNRHLASSGYPPFNLYNFGVSEDMYNVLSDEQKEVRRRVIKKFVTLLHTGKFRGTLEETSLLVDLMHYLQLTKIPGYSYCIQAITSQIDASNVLKIARTFFSEKSQACDNGLNAIRNRVVEVMSSIPFQKGMMKRQLKELSKDLLVDVLCHTSDTSEMPKKERVHKPTMNQAVC